MAEWIIPAIQTAASLMNNGNNTAEQISMQKQLNEQAAELNFKYGEQGAINAQQRAIDMYKKYQSPEALRAQYEAAGLNPALMYSGGAQGAGGISQGASGNAGGQQAGNISQMIMTQQQAEMQNVQKALIISEVGKNLAGAGLEQAQIKKVLSDLGIQENTKELNTQKLKVEIAEIQARTNMTNDQRENLQKAFETMDFDLEIKKETRETILKDIKNDSDIKQSTAWITQATAQLTEYDRYLKSIRITGDASKSTLRIFNKDYQIGGDGKGNGIDLLANDIEKRLLKQSYEQGNANIRKTNWETWALQKQVNIMGLEEEKKNTELYYYKQTARLMAQYTIYEALGDSRASYYKSLLLQHEWEHRGSREAQNWIRSIAGIVK